MSKLTTVRSNASERDASPHAEPLRGPHFRIDAKQDSPKSAPTKWLMEARDVRKSYRKGAVLVPVLKGVNATAGDGEFMAIVGKSGSGKSTLLHLLATLDAPDGGEIHFEDRRIDNLPTTQRDGLRNREMGVVFQFYHLLPELTTLENTILPAMIGCSVTQFWGKRRALRRKALDLLEQVGLSHRLKHRPSELSGGEMQRVAIARALLNEPKILLADEPTGNLDRQTGVQIMDLLRSLNRDRKLTIVMVTHDSAIAKEADRVVQLVEGLVSHA